MTAADNKNNAKANNNKYGRAPSPETRRRHVQAQNEQDNNEATAETGTSTTIPIPSRDPEESLTDVGPSVAGTTSTIMHMNLSAEKLLERRQAREEKKEEPQSNMACDDDWLDDQVRTILYP
jgi:hypothetical protein